MAKAALSYTVVIVTFCLCFSPLSLSLSQSTSTSQLNAHPENFVEETTEIVLFYSTQEDYNLCNALITQGNFSLIAYNVSSPDIVKELPISFNNTQAIWWFVSEEPILRPIDLFNGSYSAMNSWFQSKKGFFAITSLLPSLDMSIRSFLGINTVYPFKYPLNGSDTLLNLEIVSNTTLSEISINSTIELESQTGFFTPLKEEDLIAKVKIEGDFSNFLSGLLIPHDLRYYSSLLSLSPRQSWITASNMNKVHIHSNKGINQDISILSLLQVIASVSIAGNFPTSPNGGEVAIDLPSDFVGISLLALLGLLTISLAFFGIKTGRLQKIIFGVFSGTILFVAHVAYSPSKRRLDRSDLMTNELRARIVQALRRKGPTGAHLRELQRELDCGISSLLWHLQTLDDFDVVDHAKLGGYHVFYLTELAEGISPEIAQTIRSATAKRICQLLVKKAKKPRHLSEIAKAAGCHLETARYHVKKLEEAGLVTRIRDRARTHYVLRPDLIPEIKELVSN